MLYLTDLTRTARRREATVHAGSFTGPVVGKFSAGGSPATQLVGTLTFGATSVSVDLKPI